MDKLQIAEDIGNHYGRYMFQGGLYCVDNYDTVFRYEAVDDLLVDWIDTMVDERVCGGCGWNGEISYILKSNIHRFTGIKLLNNKKSVKFHVYIDLTHDGKSKCHSVGNYSDAYYAILARRFGEELRRKLKANEITYEQAMEMIKQKQKESHRM